MNRPTKSRLFSWVSPLVGLALGCLGILAFCFLAVRIDEQITNARIDRLFANDGEVTIERFIVLGHQQGARWPLVVDDTESARYLTAAFQHSGYLGYVPFRNHGSTYEFRVKSGQWSIDFWGDVGSDPYSPVRQTRLVGFLGSPYGHGSLLALTTIYQPAEIGLVLGCKGGLMGDPVYYWVPLQEPMPQQLSKAIYSLGQPHR